MSETARPADFISPLLQDGPVKHTYKAGLIIVSTACALTWLVCGWNIKRHCLNYNVRAEQRSILSILCFPPIAALTTLFTYLTLESHPNHAMLEAISEVVAVFSFISLMNTYLTTERTIEPMTEDVSKKQARRPSSVRNLYNSPVVKQYIIVRCLIVLFGIKPILRRHDIAQSSSALATWAELGRDLEGIELFSVMLMFYRVWYFCFVVDQDGEIGARAPRMMLQVRSLYSAMIMPMFVRYLFTITIIFGVVPADSHMPNEMVTMAFFECCASVVLAAISVWMMHAYSAVEYKEGPVPRAGVVGEDSTNSSMSVWHKLADGLAPLGSEETPLAKNVTQ